MRWGLAGEISRYFFFGDGTVADLAGWIVLASDGAGLVVVVVICLCKGECDYFDLRIGLKQGADDRM